MGKHTIRPGDKVVFEGDSSLHRDRHSLCETCMLYHCPGPCATADSSGELLFNGTKSPPPAKCRLCTQRGGE